jgi:pyruvate dehydrogenase E2 component (dihydrolipoamide acetyltransferase)
MAEIVMPRLSDTMEEGTILRWLARDGEEIARGSELVEIETDKAAMTYESDQEGVLEIVAAEGSTLAVGEVIAHVVAGSAAKHERPAAERPGEAFAAQNEALSANGAPTTASEPATVAGEPAVASSGASRASTATGEGSPGATREAERVRASPLARRMAREAGIELTSITGSGPGGRIVMADVSSATGAASVAAGAAGASARASASAAPAGAAPAAAGAAAAGQAATLAEVARAKGETTTVELSRTQQTIARRMAESKATIPEFTLAIDVDMERCAELRAELKRLAQGEGQATPTYNDMVVKAAALALREFARANGSYKDGTVQLHARVNVGVAVAANEALIVPTIFDADQKALGEIAREARALIERVRAGTITPPELGGGTFTVSNLGMYGIRSFTPIINPPQAAILSVGALEPRVVAREGGSHIRQTMTLTLVCDHRILYGADAAEFLARIRELLQTPSSLTL